MDREDYDRICGILYTAFSEVGLDYKVFGGAAISFYDMKRLSTDVDMALRKLLSEVDLFIKALESCQFSTKDEILNEIFGADPHEESNLFAMCRITSGNALFAGFHIDLCFEFGDNTYETIVANEIERNGLNIQVATPEHLLKMKGNIKVDRDQDKRDIEFLKAYLQKNRSIPDVKRGDWFD